MTGEKLAWFRVASHLRSTVEELAERITYREFLGWLDYLEWEEFRVGRNEYYLAQIAAEVRRGHVKHPKTVKIKDFFMAPAQPPAKDSKSTWLAFFNLKAKE